MRGNLASKTHPRRCEYSSKCRRSLRERRSICPSQDMPKTEDFGKPCRGYAAHENSMRFLGRVREEAAALEAPYTMANYGYGMVFYTSFRGFVEECLNLNELTSAKRVVVLGSNLGTRLCSFCIYLVVTKRRRAFT